MAGRRAGAGLALAAVALSAAGCGIGGGTTTVTVTKTRTKTVTTTRTVTVSTSAETTPCAVVTGSFTAVPGSQGAGQISYALTLNNPSGMSCYLPNLPTMQLLSAKRVALPTNVVMAGSQTQITVPPHASVVAQARFSPSVFGQGDSQTGPCQPKASLLLVSLGNGTTVQVPVQPPTSVCARGTLNFDLLKPG